VNGIIILHDNSITRLERERGREERERNPSPPPFVPRFHHPFPRVSGPTSASVQARGSGGGGGEGGRFGFPVGSLGTGDAAAAGAHVGGGGEDGASGGGPRRALLLHSPPRAQGRRPHHVLLVDNIQSAMALSWDCCARKVFNASTFFATWPSLGTMSFNCRSTFANCV